MQTENQDARVYVDTLLCVAYVMHTISYYAIILHNNIHVRL